MQSNIKTTRVYFDNLDIFRFIAAFMVVLAHTYEGWCGWYGLPGFMSNNTYKEFSVFGTYLNRFFWNLSFGVDVFFLISGFLITYLLLKEKEITGKISIKNFYIRRSLRIWPLYFFTIAFTPFIIQWLKIYPSPNYTANLLFYNNFHAITINGWEYPFAHFWSLCIEEHFYIVWPLIIAFTPVKRLPLIFSALIFLSIVFRGYQSLTNAAPHMQLYLNTISRSDALIIGAFFAYWHFYKPITIKVHFFIRMLIYVVFISSLFIDTIYSWDNIFLACFKKYFYLLMVAFMLGNYMFNPKAYFVFKKKNIFHYFGKISYGLYVYHNFLIPIIVMKIMYKHSINNMYFLLVAMIILTIVISWLSYELYEKWFLKLKEKFSVVKTRSA